MRTIKGHREQTLRMVNYFDRIADAPTLFYDCDKTKYDPDLAKACKRSRTIKKCIGLQKQGIVGMPKKSLHLANEPLFSAYSSTPETDQKLKFGQNGGAYGVNPEEAILKSLGECIERYALRKPNPPDISNKTLHQMLNKGKTVIDLSDFMNLGRSMINHLGFSCREDCLNALEKIEFNWYVCKDAYGSESTHIPEQLIFVSDTPNSTELMRLPISTGAAFGTEINGDDAKVRGILEIIERDCNMLQYLTSTNPPEIILDIPKLQLVKDKFERHNLELRLYYTTLDLKVPTVMAVITDYSDRGPAISVGSKAAMNKETAILGAILEAQQGREFTQTNYLTRVDNHKMLPDEITSLETRGLFWFDKGNIPLFKITQTTESILASQIVSHDQGDYEGNLHFLLNILSEKKYSLFFADIILPEVQNIGFHVIKSIIPELHPFWVDERFPYHHSTRLKNFGGRKLNMVPHPFL